MEERGRYSEDNRDPKNGALRRDQKEEPNWQMGNPTNYEVTTQKVSHAPEEVLKGTLVNL